MSAVRAALAEMVGLMMTGEEPGAGSPWYRRAVAALESEPPVVPLSEMERRRLVEQENEYRHDFEAELRFMAEFMYEVGHKRGALGMDHTEMLYMETLISSAMCVAERRDLEEYLFNGKTLKSLRDELDSVRETLPKVTGKSGDSEVKRDAARYRWLRDGRGYSLEENGIRGGEEMDIFVDKEMAEDEEEVFAQGLQHTNYKAKPR